MNHIVTVDDTGGESHHGVLGMRWGVRNDRGQGVRGRVSPKNMTTKELQEAVNRINLERQYSSLTKPPGARLATMVGKIAGDVTTSAVKSVAKKHAVKAVNKAVDKAIGA